jgi:four helix bundle protein
LAIRNYRDLDVWQTGMTLVVECYRATRAFPKHEIYGLASQMQRAAVSIPSNIAEGQMRAHTAEFAQFLSIASGSLAELETQIQIAQRLDYLQASDAIELLKLAEDVGKMLRGLRAAHARRASTAAHGAE